MLEFKEKANSKDRYKNRGGELLWEEKEKKAIDKPLPQVELRLKELSNQYEVKQGKPFLVWCESVKDFVSKIHKDKEEKKQKLSTRKQLSPATSLAGSSKNFAKTRQSIAKCSKRKIRRTDRHQIEQKN